MITTLQILSLFSASCFLVGALTPLMRKAAFRLEFVDLPNAIHKTHAEPIPYLGGVAIILGVLVVNYIAILSQENLQNGFWFTTTLYVPALILGIVGLIDDWKTLNPFPRFIVQSASGVFTAALLISTDTVGNPSGNSVLDAVITIFWIVGVCNSINFFDNLDGGAAGAVGIAALGIFFISHSNGQSLISASALVIFGSMLGFLIWNKNPARIYMGDAGSLFLGTLIGSLLVRLNPDTESKVISFTIPLILLAIPILDTSVAIFSRIRRGKSIFAGGQDHLSHRLLRKGFSKRQSAYILWLLAAIFVLMSVIVSMRESNSELLVGLAIIFWLVLLVTFFKSADE